MLEAVSLQRLERQLEQSEAKEKDGVGLQERQRLEQMNNSLTQDL